MRLLSAPCVANFIFKGEGKVHIVCSPGMTGDNDRTHTTSSKFFLQHRQRADSQFVVFRQYIDKAL